jgi:LCP family protein required for cell wall assembly
MTSLPSPAIAALLSFVFPGAGQAYAGDARRGALWAIPMAVFVLAVLWALSGGLDVVGLILNAQSRAALLVLNLAFFFYHLAAMFDAYAAAQRERRLERVSVAGSAPVVMGMLVALTLLLHGVPAAAGVWGEDQLHRLFPGRPGVIPIQSFEPEPSLTPTAGPTAVAGGTPTPVAGGTGSPRPSLGPIPPRPWAQDGRLDLLLVGADTGVGRSSTRTDTMILLSVDITSGKAAFFGFPRNMTNAPLPDESAGAYAGGRFPEMLSALWRRAAEQPGKFPGSDGVGGDCAFDWNCERAWRALAGTIQNLAGVQLDAVMAVDLNGFVQLVDAVGGVWIDVKTAVVDPKYPAQDGKSHLDINIQPGCQKLDGTLALAFARSRHQDSDYQRMRRQQQVLQAVRRQFDPLAMLPQIPHLLDVAADNLFTTVGSEDLQPLAQIASRVDPDRMYQVRFGPSRYPVTLDADAVKRIRQKVRNIFSEPEPAPSPTPTGRADRCPPRS